MMVLGRSDWALVGPVMQREQDTPRMLKVTQFDRVARQLAAPEAPLGRCTWGLLANANRK